MISSTKLKELCKETKTSAADLARKIARGGLSASNAATAIRNWQRGLMRPLPRKEDVQKLAEALGVEASELSDWHSCYHYAPMSARKVRLVADLVSGRDVQDALDVLKFTRKRAATMVNQVLKAAIADADEQQADVDRLYILEARVDDAGVRLGTKRFQEKDRGRAYEVKQKACHIHLTLTQR
jgi:large subunit ribosomal protein L22